MAQSRCEAEFDLEIPVAKPVSLVFGGGRDVGLPSGHVVKRGVTKLDRKQLEQIVVHDCVEEGEPCVVDSPSDVLVHLYELEACSRGVKLQVFRSCLWVQRTAKDVLKGFCVLNLLRQTCEVFSAFVEGVALFNFVDDAFDGEAVSVDLKGMVDVFCYRHVGEDLFQCVLHGYLHELVEDGWGVEGYVDLADVEVEDGARDAIAEGPCVDHQCAHGGDSPVPVRVHQLDALGLVPISDVDAEAIEEPVV